MAGKTSFWSSPVPYFENRKEIWIAILCFCLFVMGFLLFFQPFGVNNYNPTESISKEFFLGILCFTVVIGLVLALNEMIIRPRLFTEFNGWQAVIWLLWTLVFLSSVIYIAYNILGGWHDWSIRSYLGFIINLGTLSCIPTAATIFYLYQKSLHRKLMDLTMKQDATSAAASRIVLTADNGEEITLPVDQILYLESQDNYVAIYYNQDDSLRRHLLRGTLKRLSEEVEGSSLVRCHRAYIVNIARVSGFSGNLHKMRLTLQDETHPIPVSRNYTEKIQKLLLSQDLAVHPK